MVKPRVGVIGAGVVGKAMQRLCGPETVMYDTTPNLVVNRDQVLECDAVFVCVPTPMGEDGVCDTSIVEEVVSWLDVPLVLLRSTVSPGTTDRLREQYGRPIVFQPEYLGETPAHVFADVSDRTFVVLGGTDEDTSRAADLYKHYYNAMVHYYFCDAKTAEIAKYMENAFYAIKVTFVNEFYEIAKAHGIDYNRLREIWLADTRISRDHTFVYPENRGFTGKCLPKDVNAIIHSCRQLGLEPELLKVTLQVNELFRAMNGRKARA